MTAKKHKIFAKMLKVILGAFTDTGFGIPSTSISTLSVDGTRGEDQLLAAMPETAGMSSGFVKFRISVKV